MLRIPCKSVSVKSHLFNWKKKELLVAWELTLIYDLLLCPMGQVLISIRDETV